MQFSLPEIIFSAITFLLVSFTLSERLPLVHFGYLQKQQSSAELDVDLIQDIPALDQLHLRVPYRRVHVRNVGTGAKFLARRPTGGRYVQTG